jgi:hypothetical protein
VGLDPGAVLATGDTPGYVDRARVIRIAENARRTFEGVPGLRFTTQMREQVTAAGQRSAAMNRTCRPISAISTKSMAGQHHAGCGSTARVGLGVAAGTIWGRPPAAGGK